jgi:hypothetical protein
MPRLGKGGKWIFGWVVVGLDREIRLGFIQEGPIFEEALRHDELQVFAPE